MSKCQRKIRYVHVSIDDVIECMQINNGTNKRRHFLLTILRLCNALFGLKITLYLFRTNGTFDLKDSACVLRDYNWLKFGYHADYQSNSPIVMSSAELDESIKQVHSDIIRFSSKEHISSIIRMHFWDYRKSYISVLKKNGYTTLLVKKNQCIEEMEYWETRLKVETCAFREIRRVIKNYDGDKPLVIFSHEWALKRPRVLLKFIYATYLLNTQDYQFIV